MIFAALCFLCASSLHAQWTLSWGDDFNGTANTTYNHNNWSNEVKENTGNVWGDGTIHSTSDSISNVYLDGNGDLIIAMTYNANPPSGQTNYESARLHSLPTTGIGPYGQIEARVQNPGALGMGAAVWAMGADNVTSGIPWPWCGELDMMEIQAKTNQHNGSTIHGGQTDGQTYYEYGGLSTAVNLTGSATFDNGFHVFTTEWMPYSINYLLDGIAYGSVNLANIGYTDQWDMNQPMGLILSSGVGGNGGTPNGQGFPSNMIIDYVHYNKWSAGAPAPVTGLTATATNSNAVTLSWTASTTSGVTYDIYATTTSGTTPALPTLIAQKVTGTSYVSTGLMPSTTYYYAVMAANYGGESSAAKATVTTQASGNSTGLQLSAGGYAAGTYMNSNPPQPAVAGAAGPASFVLGGSTNYHWTAGPPAGLTAVNTAGVTNPAPQEIYNVERWGAAAWTITGLNPLAGYNVRLHFVDFGSTAVGLREFNVSINSQQVLTNFDIYATTGAINTAVAKEYYTIADSYGIIEIQTLVGAVGQPTIEAIEIIPATGSNPVGAAPGTTTDLAINSGGPAVGSYVADEDFNGGDTSTNTNTVSTNANSAPAAVYNSQRYVPFTYVLKGLVANATYTVKMHFAETYWTAAGKRIFSVTLNGQYVITDLDVFKTAGGINIAYDPQFTTTADNFGQIIVQLIYGGADQPFINGIEAVKSASSCSAAPSAPTNLAASAQSSSAIGLTWTAVTPPANCTISGYTVYGGTTANPTTVIANGVTGTSYTNSGLAASTTYYYLVKAVDSYGTSPASAQAQATTLTPACSAVTAAPTGLTAAATSSTAIGLNWTAPTPPTGCTVSSYTVYGGTTANPTTVIASGVTSTSYTNSGLTPSTTYYYKVAAVDSYGTSAASAQAQATTLAGSCSAVPSAPTGLTATASSSSAIGLTWTAVTPPANCTISGYTVYGGTTANPTTVIASGVTGTTYNNTGLAASTTYYYLVKAVDSYGTSPASNQASATTQPSGSGGDFIAIACGGPAESNSGGGDASFVADKDFVGGAAGSSTTHAINLTQPGANAAPTGVYQHQHDGTSTYTIPGMVANSQHTVLLHFSELYFTAAGKRVFNVAINGTPVLTNLDIYATVGEYAALEKTFTATANSSGQIVIAFTTGTANQPAVAGIEIR